MRKLTKQQRFNAVFDEFRRVGGGESSTLELMRLATGFLELIDAQRKRDLEIAVEQRAGIQDLAVDVALDDGGWRVLSLQRDIFNAINENEVYVPERTILQPILHTLGYPRL